VSDVKIAGLRPVGWNRSAFELNVERSRRSSLVAGQRETVANGVGAADELLDSSVSLKVDSELVANIVAVLA